MRVACARVRGQQVPWPAQRDPAPLDRLEPGRANGAVVRIETAVGTAAHEIGSHRHDDRRLHLARMIVGPVADAVGRVADRPEPVDEEEMGRGIGRTVQLPEHPLEIVAAVAVQEHDAPDPVVHEARHEVAGDREQRRRHQVEGQPHAGLVRRGAVGNRGKQRDAGTGVPGPATHPIADLVGFERVGAVREMEIVRLGAAVRDHRHVETGIVRVVDAGLDLAEGRRRQSPGSRIVHGVSGPSAGRGGWIVPSRVAISRSILGRWKGPFQRLPLIRELLDPSRCR